MHLFHPISRAVLCAYLLLAAPDANANGNDRFARIVLFVDLEAEAPENYRARLASLALRTEAFLDEWMSHWGPEVERSEIFARKENGEIEVSLVSGKLLNPNGRAALPDIRKKAIEGASKELSLNPQGPPVIWWIFYDYPGVKGFQGRARGSGGIAINAYPKGEGLIGLEEELASDTMNDMAIKGAIHELGHALGLPHVGPRPDLNLGNTLMGPINRAFWQRSGSEDERVYLSEASALMIRNHPVFQKKRTENPRKPENVSVEGLTFKEADGGKSFSICGKITASMPANTVIAYDSERGQFGDYWARTYTAEIDPGTGDFEVVISQPYPQGTVLLAFCFDSGVTTAGGNKPFQQGSSISARYSGKAGARQFEID